MGWKTKVKNRRSIKNAGSWTGILCGISPPLRYGFIMQRMSSDMKIVDESNISTVMKLSDAQMCHNSVLCPSVNVFSDALGSLE